MQKMMPSPIVVAALVCSGLASAAESEPRAGVWETSFARPGELVRLRLVLEVSKTALGTDSPRTTIHGSVHQADTFEGRVYWNLVSSCPHVYQPQLQLDDDHLAFLCSKAASHNAEDRSLDLSGFEGRFDPSYTQLWGRLQLGRDELPAKFVRPQESSATALAGHWVASGLGQTCLLHVYDGVSTMDIYTNQQATFGMVIGSAETADGGFRVSWSDIGPHTFIGLVDVEGRSFEGTWFGRGHCSDGHHARFTRFNIE